MKVLVTSLVIFLCVGAVSCRSMNPTSEPQGASWSQNMQGLAGEVKDLLPYLYDRAAFEAPENRERVQNFLNNFAQGAHKIDTEMAKGLAGDDPMVSYSLENLSGDLQRASASYGRGQFEYARYVTKSSLNHCFRCHSVTQAGASAAWDLETVQDLKLAPLEKADLLVATRKYDKALAFLEQLLNSNQFLKERPFDYESALRHYLALMIRVQNNPARALEEMKRISKNPETPHYISEQLGGWIQSLERWSKEKASPKKSAKGVLRLATERFQQARRIQRFEKDHAGDVEFLRVTSILHEGLRHLKSEEDQAQALFLLGNAYEVLDELGSWNLHETYYEMCVRRAPRAAVARKCINRLEASIFMGYSGSAGTNIPMEERERVESLKRLVK